MIDTDMDLHRSKCTRILLCLTHPRLSESTPLRVAVAVLAGQDQVHRLLAHQVVDSVIRIITIIITVEQLLHCNNISRTLALGQDLLLLFRRPRLAAQCMTWTMNTSLTDTTMYPMKYLL